MQDEVKELMDTELTRELEDAYLRHPTEDGYDHATDRLSKLYKVRSDEKLAEEELELKKQQAKDAKKDRWIKLAVDIAGILVPIGFYGIWMKKGLKFEETGSFTSTTFRGLLNKFKPTK